MNLLIIFKLALYYLFNVDISITKEVSKKIFCTKGLHAYCIPYFSNGDLNNQDINIEEVIIAVHGILRNSKVFCSTLEKNKWSGINPNSPSILLMVNDFFSNYFTGRNKR